ncbi:type III secretion protein D|uniref:Type III secretion protein D n=1 Tax=Brenneria salicis ATCC 15712 = DSM 30166 TaxID=714314 RepID=A0A366I931_9GAMM|nr:FHA domain-containing protein [Brenneria salicis]NMN91784.1 type III secretion protein D [Brenneria salicis ATCC 15712 = DSM 30166]RBP65851.1 type III secretion protein D [Brenneria salicis ATCC 15712 = DSM 30166]RLM31882.1 EscD/YscD/HrpQ family type III secretion system inner membrane ring protein [Brenneria salicis ATCC 15712 = DSM 30166]
MFELRVLSGLHRGAALPLSGSSWLVGAADDADLVLYDPGIKSYHCQLTMTPSDTAEAVWSLCAREGALCNAEGHAVTGIDVLPPGTPFAAGQIWLCVVAADTPWQDDDPAPLSAAETEETPEAEPVAAEQSLSADDPVPNPPPPTATRLPLWAKGCYLLLCLLLLVMVGSWQLQESVAMSSAPSPQDTRLALGTLPQLNSVLRTMLRERELDEVVKLASSQDRITLTGHLTPDTQKKLERMLVQLHQRYRTALTIDNRTRLRTTQLPFQIVQVTGGARANVVTADGRRFFVGDEIDNLRLVSINENQIEFNGKQQIKVNW